MSAIKLEVVVHNALVSAIPEALGGKLSGPLQEEHYAALTSAVVTAIYDNGTARIRELEAQNAELRRHRVKLIEVGAQLAREVDDAHRDEVALEIGRDALRDGLVPTLNRLVGETNARKLLANFLDQVDPTKDTQR